MKNENIQGITEGFALQGSLRESSRIAPYDEGIPFLRPIPIQGRLIGKAIGALKNYGVLEEDEHAISVVTLRKDRIDSIDVEAIGELVPELDADKDAVVQIIRELLTMLQIQLTSETIKDGEYFAFYWVGGWSRDGGSKECSHAKTALDGDVEYCTVCGNTIASDRIDDKTDLAELGADRAAESEGYNDQ